MKFFVIFLVFVCEVFAVSLTEIRDDFNSANYAKVCNQKVEDFLKTQNNEEQISMFGIACIKMNDLNRLATPIDKLVKSEKSRENAAYFADILFKKKLLFHAMIDGVDISYIRLPKSDYILSFLYCILFFWSFFFILTGKFPYWKAIFLLVSSLLIC